MEIPKVMSGWSRSDKIAISAVVVAVVIALLNSNVKNVTTTSSGDDNNKTLQLPALVKLSEEKSMFLDRRELLDSLSGTKVEGIGYFSNLDQVRTGQYLMFMYDTVATTSWGWSRGTLFGCSFSREWYPFLRILHKDEKVNFSGEISHGYDSLQLENCELVRS